MRPNTGQGKLIVLEGLDGAGTTSQSNALSAWLRQNQNLRIHMTREPSQGPAGAQIRAVLSGRLEIDRLTLAALFAADRLDHLHSPGGVIERLDRGEWVIMDRYYLSSFAYQSLDLDTDQMGWLRDLHQPCLIPDVTFFLNVPVATCLERIALNRGFHFELYEDEKQLLLINERYLQAIRDLRSQGEKIQIVDGAQSVKAVTDALTERLDLMFFNETRLLHDDLNRLWELWPALNNVRRQAEERLGLELLSVRRLPVAERAQGGGYLLDLASAGRVYHVAGYFNRQVTSVKLYVPGKADEIQRQLEIICKFHVGPTHKNATLPLWKGA